MLPLVKTLLADIKVRAFLAVVTFVFDGMFPTDVTFVFVEKILVFKLFNHSRWSWI